MMTPTGVIQPQDAKYIKRRVKSGSIDVHPTETALIVNYEVEAIILGESENPVLSDKKNCQKIIRLKSLNKNSDCAALAKEVVHKCSLIHPSKVADVEHLIYFLQSRKENAFADGLVNMSPSSCIDGSQSSSGGSGEKASFANLEQYVELLYEELNDKVKGAGMIMQLSRENDNLEELTRNEAVLSALARVLREDYKRSLDLSINIVSVFYSFSAFSQFHPLILQYKIGSLCIVIIEFELGRYEQWKAELLMNRGREVAPMSRLPVPKSARPSTASADRRRSSTPTSAGAPSAERTTKRLSLIPAPKTAVSPRSPNTPDEESSQKKFAVMVAKQDRLLKVNFSLLLNIGENVKVEDKIRKRNIVSMLVQCLERNNVPLLIVVTKFLTKLSVRLENKDEMANLNVVEHLPKLLQMNSFELEQSTLQLLFNLSFDTKLRDNMIRVGFLQKLTSLLGDERHLRMMLKILYHLSLDDRVKAMFTFTDSLPKVMKMLISMDPKSEIYLSLIALAVNVALSPRCAEVMCESGSLQNLEQRALAYQDPLLMKVIRNLSKHSSTHKHFLGFADDLLQVLPTCSHEDFLLETTGTLANLPLYQVDIYHLITKHHLLPWIDNSINSDKSEDDFVLEVVMLVGAMAADESCSKLFCQTTILSLIELLKRKQEDDEMVLQIIYVFYQASRHTESRHYLIHETRCIHSLIRSLILVHDSPTTGSGPIKGVDVPSLESSSAVSLLEAVDYLIDLMNDKNTEIRKVCDACIDMIKEEEPEYEERVKAEKFTAHNSHWLAMVENKALETSLASLPDYGEAIPRYDLNQSLTLLNAGSHVSLSTMDDIEIISNHPMSDDGSRPLSRYDSETEDFSESQIMSNRRVNNNEDMIQNALRNLVIADESTDAHHYYHIDSPKTQVALS